MTTESRSSAICLSSETGRPTTEVTKTNRRVSSSRESLIRRLPRRGVAELRCLAGRSFLSSQADSYAGESSPGHEVSGSRGNSIPTSWPTGSAWSMLTGTAPDGSTPFGGQMFFGYLDPGTGSMIIQAVIGAIAGIALFFKVFWRRIANSFGKKKKTESVPPSDRAL